MHPANAPLVSIIPNPAVLGTRAPTPASSYLPAEFARRAAVSQLFGHQHTGGARRGALQLCGDLVALLEIKARRLEGQREQGSASAAALPRLFFRQRDDVAAEPVAAKIIGQVKPLDKKQAESREQELALNQVLEVSNIHHCMTTQYPTNEEILERAAKLYQPPVAIHRVILLPEDLPAEYEWTRDLTVRDEKQGGAVQKLPWETWLKLIEWEKKNTYGHAAPTWSLL